MKKLVKFFAIVIAMLVVNGDLHAQFTEVKIGNLYYSLYDSDASVIESQDNSKYTGVINIPSTVTYNGKTYNVWAINNKAFYGCTGVTAVTIPTNTSSFSIGTMAFYGCTGLTSITIPSNVKWIYSAAFMNCTNLKTLNYGAKEASYGYNTGQTLINPFEGCVNLEIVNISSSVESLPAGFLKGCTKIETVIIPNGIDYILPSTFENCSGLTYVSIPNSVTTIYQDAFAGCSSLVNVSLGTGVKTIGEKVFYGCYALTNITIPQNVTSIEKDAFSNTGLTIINWNATKCPRYDFSDLTTLTTVNVGSTVTTLPNYFLLNCSNLKNVTITNGVSTIGYGAFAGCEKLKKVVFPNSVTSIDGGCFAGCNSLTEVTLPNKITVLKSLSSDGNIYGFFHNCISLTSITIPNSVTALGDACFAFCESLSSVTLPENVKTVPYACFYGCSNLQTVSLGKYMESIGDIALDGCSKLNTIHCKATAAPTATTTTFKDVATGCIAYVPCGKSASYEQAKGWADLKIIEDCGQVGIEDVEEGNILSVYPNPAKEQITIEGKGDITVINNAGQVVKTLNGIRGTKEINVSDLENGVYYINNGNTTQKVIIEK